MSAPRSMTGGRLAELERLHRAPKNDRMENLRMVSRAQLDFYYAAHDAVPDLLAVARAARLAAASAPVSNRPDDQTSDCDYYMAELRKALEALEEPA